jgi:hypothetical protein
MDLSSIPQCPVLYPTFKEFDNFREYMETLDHTYKKDHGMVKVTTFSHNNSAVRNLHFDSRVACLLILFYNLDCPAKRLELQGERLQQTARGTYR